MAQSILITKCIKFNKSVSSSEHRQCRQANKAGRPTTNKAGRPTRHAGQQGMQANKACRPTRQAGQQGSRPTRQAGQQGRQINEADWPVELMWPL